MKIAILHQDLEWPEKELKRQFEKRNVSVDFVDISSASVAELKRYDLVLNRIYASVANRNYKDNLRTLSLLADLEKEGVFCLNSYQTSLADYSKFASAELMKKNNVLTPETVLINNKTPLSEVLGISENFGFPLILKRDMGGRGKNVFLVNDESDLKNIYEKIFSEEFLANYSGNYVIQKFIKSVKPFDTRVAIVNGEFAFSFSRTLISEKSDEPLWLASLSKGSTRIERVATEEEIDLAMRATKSIGALFNEVDITYGEDGPVIIENNPTPNYNEGEDEERVACAVDLIIKILKGDKN